jgi:hypothetical protein
MIQELDHLQRNAVPQRRRTVRQPQKVVLFRHRKLLLDLTAQELQIEKVAQDRHRRVAVEFIWELLKLWKPLLLSSGSAETIKNSIRPHISPESLWYHCGGHTGRRVIRYAKSEA